MNGPLVSIVTPSLNQGCFLPHAIESVLRQDYPNLEYIVVDGGSTDGSLEILRSYQDRLRWVSEPDSGQSNALNKGFQMARGEIVAWINADDVLLAGAVSKAAAAFTQDPDLGMVYGEGYIIDEDGCVKHRFPHTASFDLWRLIHVGDCILQQSVFMRKGALQQIGYIDESLHWGMDWDLFIRLGKRFRVKYLDEYLGCIREYSATKTSTGGTRRLGELGRIIRRHAGRLFVPAYFSYGLDTWYSTLSQLCGPAARGALDRLHFAAGSRIWRYMDESQGWYPGGWAGPSVHLLFPNLVEMNQLEIEGSLPQLSPEPPRQMLSVLVNGKRISETLLPVGPFRIVEKLPNWVHDAEMLQVDLIASRSICEGHYSHCRQPRRLCYVLRKVQIGSTGAAETTCSAVFCVPPNSTNGV